MKKLLILCATLLLSILLQAQVTDPEKELRAQSKDTVDGWKKGAVISANIAQTQLTNWAAGGENSLAVNGLFSVFADYKKDKIIWDNSLDIGYGILGTGNDSLVFNKTDDKIDLLSKYGYKAYKDLYYAGLFNFKTQIANGYDDNNKELPISTYLAPAYITLAIGIDYKPNSNLSVFAAPFTSRTTIVTLERLSNEGAFGVEPGETRRSEFGGYVRVIYKNSKFKAEVLKNVSLTSKLDLFSNYTEKPQNIDVNWENQIAFKVNKYITVNFNTHLIYDDDIKNYGQDTNGDGTDDKFSPKAQFKEILGVGFQYKF